MVDNFKIKHLDHIKDKKYDISFLDESMAEKIVNYHKSFPQYKPTPFVELKNLTKRFGVKDIMVKDESYRFGLNAFKVLGGSYALGNYICEKLGMNLSELTYSRLISKEVREKLGDITFITATDGNHGRGVAWTAHLLKQKCVVYMPFGSAKERVDNIAKEGADVTVQDCNYDEAVRMADQQAKKNGWVLVQDTAWKGYEDIPKWIMQGYMTMAYEMEQALREQQKKPTHIFLQAGVGSLASAVTGYFSNVYKGKEKPIITIVEPNAADCLYQSSVEGKRVCITGSMQTIMAGLACGEPNTVACQLLMDYADNFISVPDYFAAYGMRVLGNPLGDDKRVISGESGAAPFGAISKVLSDEKLSDVKEQLNINENSVLLFISTEGDTDKKNYRDVVWDGKYSSIIND